MNKVELSDTIKQLKEIKPRQEWVSLLKSEILSPAENKIQATRNDIFAADKKPGIWDIVSDVMSQRRFAYASATFVFMVVCILGFTRYTMPGDALYPVKKVAEQQIQTPLKIAQNRSEELVRIAKENKTDKLEPALIEYKASISDAVKNLADALVANSNKEEVAQVISEVRKIQENQLQLQTLGINMGEDEEISQLNAVLASIVESQIADLEKSTLTEPQAEILSQVKELFEEEDYSGALEKILEINK